LVCGTRYGGFAQHERHDAVEATYRRWSDAVRAVGMQDRNVVLDVACHDCLRAQP
jgi:ketosteroid isomerase-like protein